MEQIINLENVIRVELNKAIFIDEYTYHPKKLSKFLWWNIVHDECYTKVSSDYRDNQYQYYINELINCDDNFYNVVENNGDIKIFKKPHILYVFKDGSKTYEYFKTYEELEKRCEIITNRCNFLTIG